jgi:hypothetical protein
MEVRWFLVHAANAIPRREDRQERHMGPRQLHLDTLEGTAVTLAHTHDVVGCPYRERLSSTPLHSKPALHKQIWQCIVRTLSYNSRISTVHKPVALYALVRDISSASAPSLKALHHGAATQAPCTIRVERNDIKSN